MKEVPQGVFFMPLLRRGRVCRGGVGGGFARAGSPTEVGCGWADSGRGGVACADWRRADSGRGGVGGCHSPAPVFPAPHVCRVAAAAAPRRVRYGGIYYTSSFTMLKLLNISHTNVHTIAYVLAAVSIFGYGISFIRDRVFAHYFGTGELLDIYIASFRIPDTLFIIATAFISVYALLPMFEEKLQKNAAEFQDLSTHHSTTFFCF